MKTASEPGQLIRVEARGLLFDMDGVLVSSLGSVERSWERWAKRHGKDVSSTIRAAHGRRAIDTLRKLLPEGDAAAELKIIEDLEVADNEGLKALDGVIPMLESIPPQSWTVVTSATTRLARSRLLHGGIPLPDAIITGDMVERGKPSPDPYLKGAEILGVRPEECIVIEDTAAGARAGRQAGARVLATTFSFPMKELSEADWVVHSLADVAVSVADKGKKIELAFVPLARL